MEKPEIGRSFIEAFMQHSKAFGCDSAAKVKRLTAEIEARCIEAACPSAPVGSGNSKVFESAAEIPCGIRKVQLFTEPDHCPHVKAIGSFAAHRYGIYSSLRIKEGQSKRKRSADTAFINDGIVCRGHQPLLFRRIVR